MDIVYRYEPSPPGVSPPAETPELVEQALREGNRRYATIVEQVRTEVMGGVAGRPMVIPTNPVSLAYSLVPGEAPPQHPFAIVLGCSDARAPVELIFDQSSNELFIVRVAGNVLGTECLGSVEYAVRHLSSNLRLIVVLGHTGCGAVAAAVDLYLKPEVYGAIVETHSLRSIIDRILVVVRIADKALTRRTGTHVSSDPGYRQALWQMAIYLNAALTAHDLARELDLTSGKGPLKVVYGVYNLARYRVDATPQDDRTFAPAPATSEEFIALSNRLADQVLSSGTL